MQHPLVNIGIKAALAAGKIITRSMDRVSDLTIREKELNDYVSEVDVAAEQSIIEVIHAAYPDHAILGEEGGVLGEHDIQWIIDPLDGTRNFLHGFPHYAVSIAVSEKGKLQHGIIYDPLRKELFTASKGSGARLNDRKIRVTQLNGIEKALLGTGFPYKKMDKLDVYLDSFRAIFRNSGGVRRAGSAALDLAYVASGRLDGFWEFGLSPWDIAAGIVLIREAGGLVGDLQGGENYMKTGDIVAGNPKIFKALLKAVAPFITEVTTEE